MNAPKSFEHRGMPGLYAHADSIDAESSQHLCFLKRHSRGIHFERPLFQLAQVEPFSQSGEQMLQLFYCQSRRCAATEKDRLRPARDIPQAAIQFDEERIKKCLRLVPIRSFFI